MRTGFLITIVCTAVCLGLVLSGVVLAVALSDGPDAPLWVGLSLGGSALGLVLLGMTVPAWWLHLGWRRHARRLHRAGAARTIAASTLTLTLAPTDPEEPEGDVAISRQGSLVAEGRWASDSRRFDRSRVVAGDRELFFRDVSTRGLSIVGEDGRPVARVVNVSRGFSSYLRVELTGASGELLVPSSTHRATWACVDDTGDTPTVRFDGVHRAEATLSADSDPVVLAAVLWHLTRARRNFVGANLAMSRSLSADVLSRT